MPDVIRIGQTIYSWNSTAFKFDNQPFSGVVATDFEQKRERKTVYAARQDGLPLGVTAGKYSVEAFSVKMLVDSYDALTTYLSAKGLGSYGDPPFSYLIQTTEPPIFGAGLLPLNVSSPWTWIVGDKEGREEGVDEALVEVTLASLYLTKNGKSLYSIVRGLGSI